MKSTQLYVFICVFILGAFLSASAQNVSDEKSASLAWENYIRLPSTENAKRLSDAFPKNSVEKPWKNLLKILESNEFRKLEINAFSGDKNAVNVLFVMCNVSDGYASELLDVELGLLLRINPRCFLEGLQSHRSNRTRLDALLGNYGPFNGDAAAMKLEISLRVMSLHRVEEKNLMGVRNECIEELTRQMRKLKK